MGPDPFNMPSAGAAGIQSQLGNFYTQAAPLATTYHGALTGPSINYNQITPKAPPKGGALSQFAHFIGGVGSEIGHLAAGATSWLAKNAVDFGESLTVKPVESISRGILDRNSMTSVNAERTQLSGKMDTLMHQYKSGQISAKEYKLGLNDINQDFNNLVKESTQLDNKITADKQSANNTAVNLISDALIFGAPALEGGMAAAKGLVFGPTGNELLAAAERNLGKVAANRTLFDGLSDGAKQALQQSTAEVVANAGTKTASNIARSAILNLAIKYPVYYNYLSSTGSQIYNELDNKNYEGAVRTMAFNAALLLSGGPIGQALKYGGKAIARLGNATFGRTPFIDELSKGLFGDEATLYLAAKDNPDYVKGLSSLEATHLARAGGDPVTAAWNVINGEASVDGVNAIDKGASGWLEHNFNWASASKDFTGEAERLGLKGVVAGRWTIAQATQTAKEFAESDDKNTWQSIWNNIKARSPNSAIANNQNLEAQIQHYMKTSSNGMELAAKINRIPAGSLAKGIPSSIIQKWGEKGFVPVFIPEVKTPFVEGTGKIASRFASNNDFFTKAVQPLPILSGLGTALTKIGLSPYASTQRVYQIFNDNLAENLKNSGLIKDIMGEDPQDTADTLIKNLSSYAKNPTRGKIISKAPITDLRMLTRADIRAALEVSKTDAAKIQQEIARSYTQVPIALRGLGDKAVDLSYKGAAGAVQRRYLRVLGAARFSWNPFFQYLRVIPKTEILTSAEGGGYINAIFAGRGREINAIRQGLRERGILDEVGRGGILGNTDAGEAAEFGGTMGRNLNKKLLPAQEASIAGLIDAQARRMGMDWKTYADTYPQQVRDTVQAIAEYDKRSNILNSPLMRTLNIAFFPLRFDTKVASVMARGLSRTSLLTQVSVINGLMRAHDFLNSPEGEAWYSQNSQVLGLLNYVSPVAKMNEIFESLLPGHDHSLGNFGEVGGLPLGWLPALLDSEGLTHFNQPGVDAKTGAIIPQYIPVTQRGQLAIAIQDFLTQLFAYPGATVGLPSKSAATRTLALGFVGANKKTDLQLSTPNGSTLSPQQQQFSANTQSLANTSPQSVGAQPQPLTPGTKVPSIFDESKTYGQSPVRKAALAKSAKTKSTKLKKAQFKPSLLPGQSSFGQL